MDAHIEAHREEDAFLRTCVKAALEYLPKTGQFFWRRPQSPFVRKGDLAGTMHRGRRYIYFRGQKYSARRLAWLYEYGTLPRYVHSENLEDPSDDRICNLWVKEYD